MIYIVLTIIAISIFWWMKKIFKKNKELGDAYNKAAAASLSYPIDFSEHEYPEMNPRYEEYILIKWEHLHALVEYYSTWISLTYKWNSARKQELKELTGLFSRDSIPEKTRSKIKKLMTAKTVKKNTETA